MIDRKPYSSGGTRAEIDGRGKGEKQIVLEDRGKKS